ncbi:hypothetical protein M9H77_17641 [Catharanthus roseus]|uniref:Uncharacterized protein n=1 Tax=Catharanthus roseus TaxID=4058 RepID=A0ACC0B560_CATRO|nr:hypothetical protein M9H77_17641 [Catharanthus roseus]
MDSEIRDLAFLLDQISTEHISKIQKSSSSGSESGSGSGLDVFLVSMGEADHHELLGVEVEGARNCGYRIVTYFVFGDEHQWLEVRRRICFELEHTPNMYVSLFGSVERYYELIHRTKWQEGLVPPAYWLDTPNSLYVIANAFKNLCTIVIDHLININFLLRYATKHARWMPIAPFIRAMAISL